jgi:hypothetical protein
LKSEPQALIGVPGAKKRKTKNAGRKNGVSYFSARHFSV